MLLSLFSSLFCQTPFAGLLLRQSEFQSVRRSLLLSPPVAKLLRIENLLSVVNLVREGPLGKGTSRALDGPIRANRFADSRGSP